MTRNWLEEIVAELYRLKKYMVLTDVDMQMSKTKGRKVRDHSDIDVLAIDDKGIIHAQCQSWWGSHTKQEEENLLKKLKERYEESEKLIPKKFPLIEKSFGNKLSFKRKFITSGKPTKSRGGPWDRSEKFCNENNIELIESSTILKELIEEIKQRYPKIKGRYPERIGKEESYVTRTIMDLYFGEFLK